MHRRYLIYGLLFFMSFLGFFDRTVLSVSLPTISKTFNLTLVAQGYILSAFVWSLLLLKVPAGALLDRFGTRSVSAASMMLASVATAATALCPNFLSLFVVQVLMGAGQAPNLAAPIRAIRDWVPLKERAAATAVATSVGISFGVAISAIVTAWLLSWLGWQGAFAFAGALGMIWVVCWLALFRDPSEARWLGELERQKILQERSSRSKKGTGLPLGRLIRFRSMRGLMLVQGCLNYTNFFALLWLPSYLLHARGLDILHSGMAVGLIYIGSGLASVVVGWLSDKAITKEGALKGRRRYMLAACFILSSLIVAVPFVASTWLILVLFMLTLTGIMGGFATTSALISDLVEDGNGLGKAVGLMGIGGQSFGLAAPIVTGYLLQMTGGFNSAIWFAGALLVIGAVLACSETCRPIASS